MIFFDKLFDFLIQFLSQIECVHCGSLFVENLGLCEYCEQTVNKDFKNPNIKVEASEIILSLYDWISETSDELTALVMSLKSKARKNQWKAMAEEFISLHDISFQKSDKVVFIPIPSSTGGHHSVYFAQALANICNQEYCNYLVLVDKKQQKSLSKHDRQDIRFQVNEEITQKLTEFNVVILVDDVITTGSSYFSAQKLIYEKLQKPSQLWVAFRRLI